jgi:hypothetical protein
VVEVKVKKYCPLRKGKAVSYMESFCLCIGKECAWFVGGRCAIYILARDFVGSARILAKAFERGEVNRVVRFLKYGET